MKGLWNKLGTFDRKAAAVTAMIEVVGLIVYLAYAITYNYYDFTVFGFLLAAIYCCLAYAVLQKKKGVLPLIATASETIALGVFFLNSYPVWADRLNNISMYGSRGTLVPVVINMIFMLGGIAGSFIVSFSKEKTTGTNQRPTHKTWYMVSAAFAIILIVVGAIDHTTTLAANIGQYRKDVTSMMHTLAAGNTVTAGSQEGTSSAAAETTDTKTPVSAPTDFTVDNDGNYSFTGVDDASYYMIYLCDPDATGEDDNYLFFSGQIKNEGAGQYTGNLADVCEYAYGNYLVKVLAFPELSDQEHTRSLSAQADCSLTGALSAPDIEYFWNQFNDTLYFQVGNVTEYEHEVLPDKVTITITNADDSSDSRDLTIEALSSDNNAVETDELTRGATYNISAIAMSSSDLVTSPESDATDVADHMQLADYNQMTDDFSYQDDFSGWDFPRVCANFNLKEGGEAGPSQLPGFAFKFTYDATPIETAAGSDYSYSLVCTFYDKTFSGSLELYSDGTLYLKEDGWGPVGAGSVEGIWKDNGDGTATLSYDPSTVTAIK